MAEARQGDILYVVGTGPGVQKQSGDGFCTAILDDDVVSEKMVCTHRCMIEHYHPPNKFSDMQLILRDTGIVIMNGKYWIEWELDRLSYNSDCVDTKEFLLACHSK